MAEACKDYPACFSEERAELTRLRAAIKDYKLKAIINALEKAPNLFGYGQTVGRYPDDAEQKWKANTAAHDLERSFLSAKLYAEDMLAALLTPTEEQCAPESEHVNR